MNVFFNIYNEGKINEAIEILINIGNEETLSIDFEMVKSNKNNNGKFKNIIEPINIIKNS